MSLLFDLFFTFFRIGLFTFGGGYAMIPMIRAEVVLHGWATEEILLDFIAISESTPGPFAINIATFVGMETNGLLGAFLTTLGVVLPSFIIILIVAKFFLSFSDNKYVKGALSGLRPAVVGLIASATYSIAKVNLITEGGLFNFLNWRSLVIFAIVFTISRLKKMHPIFLMLISAALGLILYGFLGNI